MHGSHAAAGPSLCTSGTELACWPFSAQMRLRELFRWKLGHHETNERAIRGGEVERQNAVGLQGHLGPEGAPTCIRDYRTQIRLIATAGEAVSEKGPPSSNLPASCAKRALQPRVSTPVASMRCRAGCKGGFPQPQRLGLRLAAAWQALMDPLPNPFAPIETLSLPHDLLLHMCSNAGPCKVQRPQP